MSIFKETQITEAYPNDIQFHYWTIARTLIIQNALSKLSKGTLLDYGCGTGHFVESLKSKGTDAIGYEPATYPGEQSNYIYRSLEGLINSGVLQRVQIVTLLDVIEHIDNPEALIKRITFEMPHLKYIVVTVPARQELWSNYDTHYGHKLRYNLIELEKLIGKLDHFRITKYGYMFRLLYIPAFFLAKLSKRQTEITPPTSNWKKLFHRFLGFILYLDYKILPKSIPGSSLLVVLERKNTI